MRLEDVKHIVQDTAVEDHLNWDGDNRDMVERILHLIPNMPEDVKQVVRWAYGYDKSYCSFEGMSDGSTIVCDVFLGGLIKEPYGVAHDMIFMLHHLGLPTPDGHTWTWWESNRWYKRAMRTMSPAFSLRSSIRWLGLTAGSWVVWRHSRDPLSRKLKSMRNKSRDEKIAFLREQARLSFGR